MKRITAFVGSARKGHTYHAVTQFMANLQSLGEVECEVVRLSDYRIEPCRGCKACFDKGEEYCPLKDDQDLLVRKIKESDGVILATPNYSFQVSGLMKLFLDRLGYIFHRPCFFGKTFTGIVVQGIYGGNKIVKYLDFVANGLGFNTVKGSCLKSMEPMTEKTRTKNDRILVEQSRRFYDRLARPAFPKPMLLKLMLFRMSRTSVRRMLDSGSPDWRYYAEHGWFDTDYYYSTHLGIVRRLTGYLSDRVAARMT